MIKNICKLKVKGLNQEKYINKIIKDIKIYDYDRISKDEFVFGIEYSDLKKTKKFLVENNFEIIEIKKMGFYKHFLNFFSSIGLIIGFSLSLVLIFFQNIYIKNYQVIGNESLSTKEIVRFIKDNFNSNKNKIDIKTVEIALTNEFKDISYASVIIKGQTLVINIKEKLLPNEIYGDFSPLIAHFDGKITKVELVSGTLNIKVGDIVKKGDILVSPFIIDSQGENKEVEANAKIYAETWNIGIVEYFDNYYETTRTGKRIENSEITLFGLEIYKNTKENKFKLFEEESYTQDLNKNIILPFKLNKHIIFELESNLVEKPFESVKDEVVDKARLNALEKLQKYDIVINEFYSTKASVGITIVSYIITAERQIGGYL